jgi:hypothetical protein
LGYTVWQRVWRGALLGAASVGPFYQALWTAITEAGLSWQPYPEYGVPLLGVILALLMTTWPQPAWQWGVALGGVVALLLWYVVAPLVGIPPGRVRDWISALRCIVILVGWCACLGLGMSLVLGMAMPGRRED